MYKRQTLKNVGDSVSTEYRVRHDDGSIVHVTGNVKLIEGYYNQDRDLSLIHI